MSLTKRRKAWYLAPTILMGIVSISTVPILIVAVGATGWADIALGQAIGLLGSVVVSLGWPVVGPATMAKSDRGEQYRRLKVSIYSRSMIFFAATGVLSALFVTVFQQSSLLVWTAIASTLLGCASSWYFLGINDPKALFWREAFPRAAAVLVGLALVWLTEAGAWFPVGLVAGLIFSLILTLEKARTRGEGPIARIRVSEVFVSIREQAKGLTANVLYVGLTLISLPIAALLGGSTFVVFVMIDKVQKQLTTVSLPFTQLLTGKMAGDIGLGAGAITTAARVFKSILIVGAGLTVVMIVTGPVAVYLMSVGLVSLSPIDAVLLALLVGLTFVAQCVPAAVLAPLEKLRYAVAGASLGILLGAPTIFFAGKEFGLSGLIGATCVTYALMILVGWFGLRSAYPSDLDRRVREMTQGAHVSDG